MSHELISQQRLPWCLEDVCIVNSPVLSFMSLKLVGYLCLSPHLHLLLTSQLFWDPYVWVILGGEFQIVGVPLKALPLVSSSGGWLRTILLLFGHCPGFWVSFFLSFFLIALSFLVHPDQEISLIMINVLCQNVG